MLSFRDYFEVKSGLSFASFRTLTRIQKDVWIQNYSDYVYSSLHKSLFDNYLSS